MCASTMQAQRAKDKLSLGGFKIRSQMDAGDADDHRIIYPLQTLAFGRLNPATRQREAVAGQFGLVPEWVNDANGGTKYGRHCYNARMETIFEKPSFRGAVHKRRALVPVTSFFEFPDKEAPLRRRYRISRKDGDALWLAAIWERNQAYGLDSVSVITTTPLSLVEKFHSRSPVILRDDQIDAWLSPALESRREIERYLVPGPSEDLLLEELPWGGKPKAEAEPELF